MRYNVDAALVEKRARCVSSSINKSDCGLVIERALKSIQANKESRRNDINRVLTECTCTNNANKYFSDILNIIETCENNGEDSRFVKNIKNRCIDEVSCYLTDDYVLERASQYCSDTSFTNRLNEVCKSNKVCDRILDNHNKISKRFNISSFVESSRNKSLDRIVLPCCNMIDTYDLKPHAKMNVCLEEISYLLQKNAIKYKKPELVKLVTEYFLTRNDSITVDDQNKYRLVLSENSMISDHDLSSVRYFTELYDDTKSQLIQNLNTFTSNTDKSITNGFAPMIGDESISKEDFCHNFSRVLEYVREYLLNDSYDISEIISAMNTIPDKIESVMNNDTWNYTREDLDCLISMYRSEIESIDAILSSNNNDKDLISKLIMLKECYMNSLTRLTALTNLVYPSYNIESMMYPRTAFTECMYLNEFKILKFQNLIRAAFEVDKFIKTKGKKLMDKIAGKLLKKDNKKKILKLKDLAVQETMTADNTIDICVQEFDILDDTDFYKVHDALTEFCKTINESVLRLADSKLYYTVLPDTVELHVAENSDLLLKEEEQIAFDEAIFTDEDKARLLNLQEIADFADEIDADEFLTTYSDIEESISKLDRDRFNLIVEMSQYTSCLDKENIDKLYEEYLYANDIKIDNYTTRNLVKEWTYKDAPYEIQLEAYHLIRSILEADEDKEDDKKDKNSDKEKEVKDESKKSITDKIKSKLPQKKDKDSNEDKKDPTKGIKLNDLKLYANGLKAKFKDMTTKEKEWSRDLDMHFNSLYKGIKNALTNDRREGIIKGSVIPSFSKCIKLGVALAGLTFINPVAGAVAAFGGLAMSKKLNKQERLLMLDEIDVELEVVDKEISMAESRNQTKRMRKLMMYKKDLQRQSQRIKYNTRIGKDIMPGSTTGLRDKE